MEIQFRNSKMMKEFNSSKTLLQKYGKRRADVIQQRLVELRAAEVLEDIRNLTRPRCHELTQNRKGQLAVNLDHPYRLIFKPLNEPIPLNDDGGLDWSSITSIQILEVVDYHE